MIRQRKNNKKKQQIIATNKIISKRVNARTITVFQKKKELFYPNRVCTGDVVCILDIKMYNSITKKR